MQIAVVSGVCVEKDAISAAAAESARVLSQLPGVASVRLFTSHLDRHVDVDAYVVADAWQLLRHAAFRDCDVVIIHWGIHAPLFDALWLIDRAQQEVIVHFHNLTPADLVEPQQRVVIERSRAQLEVLASLPLRIWTFSEYNRQSLLALGVPEERIDDVPFPIDLGRTGRPKSPPSEELRLLCVGRLVRAKGVHTLIEALAKARELATPRQIHLVIASSETFSAGSYAAELRDRVKALGLEECVRFASPGVMELRELYETSDVVVSPSLHEGLCVPIIEGYAAGCRAIGTTAGNLPYVVQNPDPLVPPDDADALARAISEIATQVSFDDVEWTQRIQNLCDRFSDAGVARRMHEALSRITKENTVMSSAELEQIRPWIDVRLDREMRLRTRTTLNRLPDISDWEPGSRFTDILRDLRQPVTIHRKSWEYGVCLLGLEQLGCLTPDAAAIAVGAGSEPPLFELANRIRRIAATDLYDNPDHEGNPDMLVDPSRFAPFDYRREHLEVHRMSGDDLRFVDNEFDIAFSLSSIEHFGSRATQRTAFDEMVRVVRPGGIICIMTELILTGHRHGEYFQWEEICSLFLDHPGVTLVGGELDLSMSESLIANPVDPRDQRTVNRSPHIVLGLDGMLWTSLSMFFEVR